MAEAQRSPSAATTELIVVSAIFPALSAVAYYLRLLSRRSTRDQSRADDYWLAFTWITTVPLSILVWVVAGRSGIQYYKIDAATGTRYSLFVRLPRVFHSFQLTYLMVVFSLLSGKN